MNPGPRTNVRVRMLLLVFLTVIINYMDRGNLALLAPAITADLNLSSVEMGMIFSAFGWAYVAFQLPGGFLVDRVAPRILYPIIMGAWSLATCALGIAQGLAGLFGLRLALGTLEAPSFPINNKVVTAWFPEQERARAISFYTSGQFVGLAFVTPILTWIQLVWGWRWVFVITGAVGVLMSVVWYFLYRDPQDSRSANPAEIDHITRGGGLAGSRSTKARPRLTWEHVRRIVSSRNVIGVLIGHTCITSTLWFFLTWFPTYLVKYRHMEFVKMGFWAAVPFIAAFCGVLVSGYFSDRIVRAGADIGTARKAPMICGLLLSTSIVGANYVESEGMVMLFMSISFFGNGLASIGWTFVSALAPPGLIGVTGGIYNFIGNSSSIFVPLVIGWLVRGGSFEPAIIFVAACAMTGVVALLTLVRNVKRLDVGFQ